jgi:hypothetical protein
VASMMRARTQGRGCPSRHGYGKCEMSDEAALVDRQFEKRRWRREVEVELAEARSDRRSSIGGAAVFYTA